MRPLLADPALRADRTAILATRDRFEELLRIRRSSPLLRLRTGAEVQARLSFPGSGPDQTPGLVAMAVSDETGQDLDGRFERILVLFNGGDTEASLSLGAEAGSGWSLHPVQAASVDPVVRTAAAADGTFTVPARTTAVFVR
jgi:hypothetical protein